MKSGSCIGFSLVFLASLANGLVIGTNRVPINHGGGQMIAWDSRSIMSDELYPCSKEDYFTHPENCTRFYRCVSNPGGPEHFIRLLFECPIGQIFIQDYDRCVNGACPKESLVEDPVTSLSDSQSGQGSQDGGRDSQYGGQGSQDGGRDSEYGGQGSQDGGRDSQYGGQGSQDGGQDSQDGGQDSQYGGQGSQDGGNVPLTELVRDAILGTSTNTKPGNFGLDTELSEHKNSEICKEYKFVAHEMYFNVFYSCEEPQALSVCESGRAFVEELQDCRLVQHSSASVRGKSLFVPSAYFFRSALGWDDVWVRVFPEGAIVNASPYRFTKTDPRKDASDIAAGPVIRVAEQSALDFNTLIKSLGQEAQGVPGEETQGPMEDQYSDIEAQAQGSVLKNPSLEDQYPASEVPVSRPQASFERGQTEQQIFENDDFPFLPFSPSSGFQSGFVPVPLSGFSGFNSPIVALGFGSPRPFSSILRNSAYQSAGYQPSQGLPFGPNLIPMTIAPLPSKINPLAIRSDSYSPFQSFPSFSPISSPVAIASLPSQVPSQFGSMSYFPRPFSFAIPIAIPTSPDVKPYFPAGQTVVGAANKRKDQQTDDFNEDYPELSAKTSSDFQGGFRVPESQLFSEYPFLFGSSLYDQSSNLQSKMAEESLQVIPVSEDDLITLGQLGAFANQNADSHPVLVDLDQLENEGVVIAPFTGFGK